MYTSSRRAAAHWRYVTAYLSGPPQGIDTPTSTLPLLLSDLGTCELFAPLGLLQLVRESWKVSPGYWTSLRQLTGSRHHYKQAVSVEHCHRGTQIASSLVLVHG